MKKKMNRLLAIAMAGTLLAGMGGSTCVMAEKAAQEELYFVYVSPLLSHPIWMVAKEGFEAACDELGIEGSWVGPQGISAEEMAQLVDTAVAQNADGIITQGICPPEPVQGAIDAGIPVLVVDADINTVEGRLAYLGKNLEQQAEMMYEQVCKSIGEDEKIVYSIQTPALNSEEYALTNQCIEEVFAKHPGGAELTNISVSNSDKATGTMEWINTFNTYPEINVCLNTGAEAAPACATAADELELDTENLVIIGVDNEDEMIDLIKAGKIDGSVVVSFWNYGYQAAYWLYEHVTEGKTPAQTVNDAGLVMVNQENVDNYSDLLRVMVDMPE